MGFDMRTARGDESFSANATLMNYLCAAIVESGVNLQRHRRRSCDPEAGKEPMEGDLLLCFASNDGWHVTEEEAAEIAERLEGALPGWIAAPKRVVPEDVFMMEVEGKEKGEPSRWVAFERIDPIRGVRPREAAEIGADGKVVAVVQKFVAFCRLASKRGGFYVY